METPQNDFLISQIRQAKDNFPQLIENRVETYLSQCIGMAVVHHVKAAIHVDPNGCSACGMKAQLRVCQICTSDDSISKNNMCFVMERSEASDHI